MPAPRIAHARFEDEAPLCRDGEGVRELRRAIRIDAPRARVWALVADHEGWPRWSPAREMIRRRPGAGDGDGVGAVRVCRVGGLAIEEAVTAFEPQERLETTLVAGAPWASHRSSLSLRSADGGTDVEWRLRLRPRLPGSGRLLARIAARALASALAGLRGCAERGGE